jgi:hypothetical protein
MAALVASRANPIIAAHYRKLRSAGKTGKPALTAACESLSSSSTPPTRPRTIATRLTSKTVAQHEESH